MSVLDSVIKLRELEEREAQNTVDTIIKGAALAQDFQKTSMLADLERQKLANDVNTKMLTAKATAAQHGLDIDELGRVTPLPEPTIEAIQKANQRPETELDLMLKQTRLDNAMAQQKERSEKERVMGDLESADSLSSDATPEEKEAWLAGKHPIVQETVKGLTDYSLDPTKFASLRTDERTKYLALAKKFDPTFTMMEYDIRRNYLQNIKNPSTVAGRNIISLNTIAHHLAQLDEELDGLKGTNSKPVNAIINWAQEMTGDPSITDVKIAYKVVKDELERALAGTVTQEALRDFDKVLNPNLGIKAQKNAVKTMVKIVRGRIQPYREQFKETLKREERGEIINPESQMLFKRYLTPEAGAEEEREGFKAFDFSSIGSEWVQLPNGARIRAKK